MRTRKRIGLGGALPLTVGIATAVGCLIGASIVLLWRSEQFSGGFCLGMMGFCIL